MNKERVRARAAQGRIVLIVEAGEHIMTHRLTVEEAANLRMHLAAAMEEVAGQKTPVPVMAEDGVMVECGR